MARLFALLVQLRMRRTPVEGAIVCPMFNLGEAVPNCEWLLRVFFLAALWSLIPFQALANERLALLIGNKNYAKEIGELRNPHNDIEVVGNALRGLNFKVTMLRDATFEQLHKAVRAHIAKVRAADEGAISFIYYSGHGASDPKTEINYLIPVDVKSAESDAIWDNSVDLKGDILDKLTAQTPKATHYVVFDACRNELQLREQGRKVFISEGKAFASLVNVSGSLVAYATEQKRTASDVGEGSGPYARALADEVVKPGIEAVTMFRNVQLRIRQSTGQNPWLTFSGLPPIYLAGPSSGAAAPATPMTMTPVAAPVVGAKAEQLAFEQERASVKGSLQPLFRQLGEAGIKSGGVFAVAKKWPKRAIQICFMDGSREVRSHVASVARQWTLYGEVDFDFGDVKEPRLCATSPAEVRVTFEAKGNWSHLGVDALTVPPNEPTISIETVKWTALDALQTGAADGRILHEFGHVLGFVHNADAPGVACKDEMDWKQVYAYFARNGVDRATVDEQFRGLHRRTAYVGDFDNKSVMSNEWPEEMFKRGRDSRCFTTESPSLSLRDKLAVYTIYK